MAGSFEWQRLLSWQAAAPLCWIPSRVHYAVDGERVPVMLVENSVREPPEQTASVLALESLGKFRRTTDPFQAGEHRIEKL